MKTARSLLLAGLLGGLLGLGPALPLRAQDDAAAARAAEAPAKTRQDGGTARPAPASGVLALLPAEDAVTRHSLTLRDGTRIDYTATVGTLPLYDPAGEPLAGIVYTAFTRDGAPPGERPLTCVFNGGPGAASAYLGLGAVGPRAAPPSLVTDPGNARLEDNPDSWLAFTDLVMIDPIGAGWSRAAKPDKAEGFWNVDADAQSVAKAIALYTLRNGRAGSPKYLLGESYGGFRAVKVARALQQDQGLFVAGIVMASPFLEGRLTFGTGKSALGAALRLPALAASALDRDGGFTPEKLDEAERFARTDYLTALAGPPLRGEAAQQFYAKVADLTGLPEETVARTRGFIGDAYAKQKAKDGTDGSGVASGYDAAVLAPDPFPDSPDDDGPDPVLEGYTRALAGLQAAYARDELGFRTDMTFQLLNRDVSRKWDWGGRGGIATAGVMDDLAELLALNPGVDVLVTHGRSDLVTPYSVSRYLIDRMPPIGGEDRLALKVYKGGHMFYFDPASRAAFTADAAAFYARPGKAEKPASGPAD